MSIYIIVIIILSFFFFFKQKKNTNENFSSNNHYNKDCESSDDDRKKCTSSFSKISTKLFNFCIKQNNNYNLDEDTNNNLCQKWIGLISSECITEKCVENTVDKINDWQKTLDNIESYKTLEKLEKLKHKYKLYYNNKFSNLITLSKESLNQKKKFIK